MCLGWDNKLCDLFTHRAKDRFMVFLSNELLSLTMLFSNLLGDPQGEIHLLSQSRTDPYDMQCNGYFIFYNMCHFKCFLQPTNFTAWSVDAITQFEKHRLGGIQGWLAGSIHYCLRTHCDREGWGDRHMYLRFYFVYIPQSLVRFLLNINEAIVNINISNRNMIPGHFPFVLSSFPYTEKRENE